MDREEQLFLVAVLLGRVRRYPKAAFDDLFQALDGIERKHDLLPRLSTTQEAEAARLEAKLERGERLPELELRGPIEDFLPEPQASILARLAELPESQQDVIFDVIRQCVDIDAPELGLSPAEVASVRVSLKEIDARRGSTR